MARCSDRVPRDQIAFDRTKVPLTNCLVFQIVSDAISTDRLLTIMKTKLIFAAFTLTLTCIVIASARAQSPAPSSAKKPNITSNTYYDWFMSDGAGPFLASPAVVGKFLATFKEYPPSQRPSSFSIDQLVEKMQKSFESTNQ